MPSGAPPVAPALRLLRVVPVFLDLAVLDSQHVVGVVLVGLGRVRRVLALALPDEHDEVALRELHHRRVCQLVGDRRDRRAGAAEELHEARAARRHVDVVLDVVFRLVLRREVEVPRLQHVAPPVQHELQVRLLLRRHRPRVRQHRRTAQRQQNHRGAHPSHHASLHLRLLVVSPGKCSRSRLFSLQMNSIRSVPSTRLTSSVRPHGLVYAFGSSIVI